MIGDANLFLLDAESFADE
jgi:hypothetical protein